MSVKALERSNQTTECCQPDRYRPFFSLRPIAKANKRWAGPERGRLRRVPPVRFLHAFFGDPVSQDMASLRTVTPEELSPPPPEDFVLDFVLGQKLLPQGKRSACTGILALEYFLWQSACPVAFSPAELLSQGKYSGGALVSRLYFYRYL